MRSKLRAQAIRQGGVFTRRQALLAGYSEQEIRRFSGRDGPWLAVRRGAYAERALLEVLDERTGLLELRDRAAHLLMDRPHLLSHDSAARCWGLPMLRPDQELAHVTRFGVGGSRTTAGVKHHLTRLGLLDAERVDDLKITGLARTALDLAREHGLRCGMMACDAAARRGVLPADFEAQLALMWCWPGVTVARRAALLVDPGAQTPGETLLRDFVLELGIGEPVSQFPVLVGARLFWVDQRVGCHLFEFDGFSKFQRPEQGGTARGDPGEVAWEEKVRQDLVCGEGLGMSRIVWAEFFGQARRRARQRVLREYELTRKRYGDQLPANLAETADRLAAERQRRLRDPRRPPSSTWRL